MRNLVLLALLTVALFAVMATNGCNNNSSNSNANANSANANRLANANAVASNVNANRQAAKANVWANVNSNMTREEYDKQKADYEADKGSSKIGGGINDSWLWFKTRAMMLVTPDLRQSTINVDVENDVVTLNGTVETAAQKAKAEQVAKDINGVKKVNNNLKVAPEDSMVNDRGTRRDTNNNK